MPCLYCHLDRIVHDKKKPHMIQCCQDCYLTSRIRENIDVSMTLPSWAPFTLIWLFSSHTMTAVGNRHRVKTITVHNAIVVSYNILEVLVLYVVGLISQVNLS